MHRGMCEALKCTGGCARNGRPLCRPDQCGGIASSLAYLLALEIMNLYNLYNLYNLLNNILAERRSRRGRERL
jgi:hypothetical protein